jgi:hypothetical protein
MRGALAENKRMKPDQESIDEALFHEPVHQANAAVHQDVLAFLLLQLATAFATSPPSRCELFHSRGSFRLVEATYFGLAVHPLGELALSLDPLIGGPSRGEALQLAMCWQSRIEGVEPIRFSFRLGPMSRGLYSTVWLTSWTGRSRRSPTHAARDP